MRKYLIERSIPGLGEATPEQLAAMSEKSNEVLAGLGPQVHWVESFVTDDTLFCYYYAENEELIREHARRGEFPCEKVTAVATVIDPTTATG